MNTRRSWTGLLLVLAVALPAVADEATVPPLEARNLELLPLNKLERQELAREEQTVAGRLALLVQRRQRLRDQLHARTDPTDSGSAQLRRQIGSLESDLSPLLARVVEAVRPHGVDDALLRHLATAPDGPHRSARYAQGLVLYVEGLPAEVRALFEYVVPRMEGVLLALATERGHLEAALAKAGLPEAQVRVAVAAVDGRLNRIENRFWRLVDYAVPQAQRAAIHRLLPTAYQQLESVVQHLYALPDLSVVQGARLKALLTELEAESAPDAALTKTLQARLPAASDGSVRLGLQRELGEAQGRLLALQRYAVDAAREILTPAQWIALEAIPPRVSLGDRQQHSGQVLAGVELTAAQRARLALLRAELKDARDEFQRRRIAVAARAAAYGPDSPKMQGMQMEMAGVQAEGNVIQRAFNGRLFTEFLTREQTLAWVLGGTGRGP